MIFYGTTYRVVCLPKHFQIRRIESHSTVVCLPKHFQMKRIESHSTVVCLPKHFQMRRIESHSTVVCLPKHFQMKRIEPHSTVVCLPKHFLIRHFGFFNQCRRYVRRVPPRLHSSLPTDTLYFFLYIFLEGRFR